MSKEVLSASVLSATGLAGVACISSITLSIQRRFYSDKIHFGKDLLTPLKTDHIRDYSVPFTNDNRLNRLLLSSLLMTAICAYNLYDCAFLLSDLKGAKTNTTIYNTISSALIFVAWTYALALSVVSRRYKLPNQWGWILNVHLFTFYTAALSTSLYSLWDAVQLYHSKLSLAQGLPLALSIFFSLDLFYATGSTEQGPPFFEGGMDDADQKIPVAGITTASIFSYLYFSWATPIVDGIYKNAQDVSLPSLPPSYRAYNIFYIFAENRGKSLVYRLFYANKRAIILQAFLTAISAALYYGPAYFLNMLLNLIQNIDSGKPNEFYLINGIAIVTGLALSIMVLSVVSGQLYYWSSSSLRVRMKSMINIEVYRKTLRRLDISDVAKDSGSKNGDPNSSSTGTIVNLMSTDSQRISDFSSSWFTIIESPIELIVGITFLYSLLGASSLLGLCVMIITLPLNYYNSVLFAKTQEKLMEARDRRISFMNEILQSIRQIKFFAWESSWERRVLETRNEEIKYLRKTYLSEILFNFLWQGTPLLVTVASFVCYTKIQGQVLTAPIAFTSITVFNELRSALNSLPETFVDILQALISVRRIESYLDEEEITTPATNIAINNSGIRIGFRSATVSWTNIPLSPLSIDTQDIPETLSRSTSTTDFTISPSAFDNTGTFLLRNLDANFPTKQFSIICGATGSGKTLLMLSLLGETVLLEGEIFCPRAAVLDSLNENFEQVNSRNLTLENWILDDSIAYVPQTAWLQNASIKANILFGLPFVEKRYHDTLYSCALDKDLSYLEDGDLTEIGEKGIILSGGQRARVALARAVYSRAGIVLMDDVLSAVDAHTARHLHNCLVGPLMEGRTRILITHHVRLCISEAAYVIQLDNGSINLCGSPSELIVADVFETILDDVRFVEEENEEETIEKELDEIDPKPTVVKSATELAKKVPKLLIKEEARVIGHVKAKLYKTYLLALGGFPYWAVLMAFVFGSRSLDIAESWWIKKWVQSNKTTTNSMVVYNFMDQFDLQKRTFDITINYGFGLFYFSEDKGSNDNLDMYLAVYVAITMTNIFVGAGRFAVLYYGTLQASKDLYQILLKRVLRAPIRFFDTTPVGRILNRFAKDFEYVDSGVPNDLMYFIAQWLVITTSILTVCAVLPLFVLPMVLVTVLNIAIGKRFNGASRELRRMESVTRSPLFTHFGETLAGVATIRAYGATRQFMKEMVRRIDENSKPFYFAWIANRWVGIRFSFLGAMVNFCTGIFVVFSFSYMDASLAGFCLSFVLSYTSQMTMAIKRFTRLEMSFNAVERIVEFTEIEQEPPAITKIRPPAEWPMKGEIHVNDLQVRYAPDLDPVLRGVTFSVRPREKIGVVGRTGSGKSTLALSFFRFVEACEGSVIIDKVDICSIGTEDLRRNLTIIPQDPVLFSGTLRSNLDPFAEFSDQDLYLAMQRVKLIPPENNTSSLSEQESNVEELNTNVFTDLESPVSEGGSNFSQGQRQLICLGRALLKRNKIVIMDEATASVDFETDESIQKTIASEFADCTILCIAHRLRTVIEYDRILVLNQGEVLEFACPLELLNTPTSTFRKMCENSGEYETLLALAKDKHQLVDIM